MSGRGSKSRTIETVWFVALLGLLALPVGGDEGAREGLAARPLGVDGLLEELRSDPKRAEGEKTIDWYARVSLKTLDVAEKLLAHPDATRENKNEAIDRKLTALGVLTGRDAGRYRRQWTEFANRVIAEQPGSVLARKAAYGLLQRRISDDPTDPGLVADVDRFVRAYPGTGGQAYQLYYRLTGGLYGREPRRSLAVLDRAITSLPEEQAGALRQYRNVLTIRGSQLPMSWPRLDGRPFTLQELRGKTVLVYSWATWCGPCIEKFGMLDALRTAHHREGFEIVAVSQDEKPADVVRFLETHKLPWVHVMRSEDYDRKYGPMGTPDRLLVDRDGVVVARGLMGRDEIESAVRRCLEKPAAR